MPELIPNERLQPCLLDRLTDDQPGVPQEGRDMRVVSMSRYRRGVLRDVAWLLNTRSHAPDDPIYEFPLAAASVLNFGLRDICGRSRDDRTAGELEDSLQDALRKFEPRISADSVTVRAITDDGKSTQTSVPLEISGDLWALPAATVLYIKTAMDLETGRADGDSVRREG